MKRLLLIGMVLCIVARSQAAPAILTNGTKITGEIRFEEGAVVINTGNGVEARLTPTQLQSLDCQEGLSNAPIDTTGQGGLTVEYFPGSEFDPVNRRLIQCACKVAGRWSPGSKDNLFSQSDGPWIPFSVRWSGQIRPDYSERYTFRVSPQVMSRLWIDHRLVMDDHADIGSITLVAGKRYDFRVDQIALNRSYALQWSSPSQPEQLIPMDHLYVNQADPAAAAIVHIVSPSDQELIVGDADVPVTVRIDPAHRQIRQVTLYDGDTLVQVVAATPYQFMCRHLQIGTHYLTALASDSDGNQWLSPMVTLNIAGDDAGRLPKTWGHFDVGTSGSGGKIEVKDQTISLSGANGELYSDTDRFVFAVQRMTADGSVQVRLADLAPDQIAGGVHPAAGLMIRKSFEPGSAHAAILYSPTVGSVFVSRSPDNTPSNNITAGGDTGAYLRLTRQGAHIRSYRSVDGEKWDFVGDTEIVDLPSTALVGLVLSSESEATAASAVFDHFEIHGEASKPDEPLSNAGVCLTDGTLLVGRNDGIKDGTLRLQRNASGQAGQEIQIASENIARIIYKPIRPDLLKAIRPDQHGVIMANGDFLEGDVAKVNGNSVEVDSEVLGPRTLRIGDAVAAVILRGVTPAPMASELRLMDGSDLQVTAIKIHADEIDVDTTVLKNLTFPAKMIASWKAANETSPQGFSSPMAGQH